MSEKITIGVSGCLLGQAVRFDGGHKRDRYVTGALAEHLQYEAFCPEMAAGLGAPRSSLRLVGDEANVRVLEPATGTDRTTQLDDASASLAERAASLNLSGFILKAASPTCGLERVRVYPVHAGPSSKIGKGRFALALEKRLPTLPVEEEGRLNDPRLRENFILRVFTHRRFADDVRTSPSRGALMRFHAAHKMLLLAHDEKRVRALGRRLATSKGEPIDQLVAHYAQELFAALSRPASRRGHQNALHHMAGFISGRLEDPERQELDRVIRAYGEGRVPLAVPMALLRVFQMRDRDGYGSKQQYGQPHPERLGLYNSI
jgi:uncharacterized protein YbgA (DUF1722 family)/uncharacterized protein YbbK (DUF523 family)